MNSLKFYGRQDIDTRSFNVWLATEEDKNWQPLQPKLEQEPMCEPEEVTVEGLKVLSLVGRWQYALSRLASCMRRLHAAFRSSPMAGKIKDRRHAPAVPFVRRYTTEDIHLLLAKWMRCTAKDR